MADPSKMTPMQVLHFVTLCEREVADVERQLTAARARRDKACREADRILTTHVEAGAHHRVARSCPTHSSQ